MGGYTCPETYECKVPTVSTTGEKECVGPAPDGENIVDPIPEPKCDDKGYTCPTTYICKVPD